MLKVEGKLLYVGVAAEIEPGASACQVERQQIRTRRSQSDAIHKTWISVRVSLGWKKGIVHDSQIVVLVQECLLVRGSQLNIVGPFDIGERRPQARIREFSILSNRLLLNRREVVEEIVTGIVV